MDNVEVGARVKARREQMGLSILDLAKEAGVDRGRVSALEQGDGTVRQTTIVRIERALADLEHRMMMDQPLGEDDMVEFRVSGNFGVDVVVRGPVRDMQALEESVSRLVQKMQPPPA